jgi:hypothetical protein
MHCPRDQHSYPVPKSRHSRLTRSKWIYHNLNVIIIASPLDDYYSMSSIAFRQQQGEGSILDIDHLLPNVFPSVDTSPVRIQDTLLSRHHPTFQPCLSSESILWKVCDHLNKSKSLPTWFSGFYSIISMPPLAIVTKYVEAVTWQIPSQHSSSILDRREKVQKGRE